MLFYWLIRLRILLLSSPSMLMCPILCVRTKSEPRSIITALSHQHYLLKQFLQVRMTSHPSNLRSILKWNEKNEKILNELKIWSQNDHRLWKTFLDSNCTSTKPRARVRKVRKQVKISTCPPCVIHDNCLILSLTLFGYKYNIIESFLTLKAQLVNQDNPNLPNRDISKPAGLIATASFG